MPNKESDTTGIGALLGPARAGIRAGIWFGEAAYNGVNKVVPITKLGRGVVHFVNQEHLAKHLEQNASAEEKARLIAEIEQRHEDYALLDYLVLSHVLTTLKQARAQVKEAVERLDPEMAIAEITQEMEDRGVPPKTIEVAVGKVRENIPQPVDRRVLDLRDQPEIDVPLPLQPE